MIKKGHQGLPSKHYLTSNLIKNSYNKYTQSTPNKLTMQKIKNDIKIAKVVQSVTN